MPQIGAGTAANPHGPTGGEDESRRAELFSLSLSLSLCGLVLHSPTKGFLIYRSIVDELSESP